MFSTRRIGWLPSKRTVTGPALAIALPPRKIVAPKSRRQKVLCSRGEIRKKPAKCDSGRPSPQFVQGVLSVQGRHCHLRIAETSSDAFGSYLVNARQIVGSELNVDRAKVFFQVFAALGAGDGNNVLTLGQHPGQRKLRRRAVLLARDLFDLCHQIKVLLEVISLEARRYAPEIIWRQIFKAFELSGKEATSERAVRDEADAEFAYGRQDLVFRITLPQRVFSLQRRDGMHFMSAANGSGRRLGKPEVTHFAGAHQFGHGANGIFNGNGFVNAMLVIKVDHVGPEPLQAGVACLFHVFRCALYAQELAFWPAHVAELGGEDDFVAAVFDGPAHEFFVLAGAVHVGGIEKGTPEFNRTMDGCDGFLIVACAIKL